MYLGGNRRYVSLLSILDSFTPARNHTDWASVFSHKNVVCYTAVVSVVTQRSSPLVSGEERCVTTLKTAVQQTNKNGDFRRDFCNGARLCRADLEGGVSHFGQVFILRLCTKLETTAKCEESAMFLKRICIECFGQVFVSGGYYNTYTNLGD